jgi:hypothetical protein
VIVSGPSILPTTSPSAVQSGSQPAAAPSIANPANVSHFSPNPGFATVRQQTWFWILQGIAVIGLLAIGFGQWLRSWNAQHAAARALRRERRRLYRDLKSQDAENVLCAATRLIEVDFLLRSPAATRQITAEQAVRERNVPDPLRTRLLELVAKRSDFVYAHRFSPISPMDRIGIRETLHEWEKTP